MGSTEALDRFERLTAWPMMLLAVATIPLVLIPILSDPSAAVESVLVSVGWFIWAAFALEYGIRLYLAPKKWGFIKGNLIDLAVVLLPFLRPLRLSRSARLLRLAGFVRAGVMFARAGDAMRAVLTKHRLNYTLLVAGAALVVSSLLVWELERTAPDSNISTISDALWWGLTTITTVGYGDRFPTTSGGRAIGAILMVLGIAFFGLLAATLSSFLLERDAAEGIDPRLDEISRRLERIERALDIRDQDGESSKGEAPE
jgi:voltage-gated potassium channel